MHHTFVFDPLPLLDLFGITLMECRAIVEAFLIFHSPTQNEAMFCKTPTEAFYYVTTDWFGDAYENISSRSAIVSSYHSCFNAFRWLFNYLTPQVVGIEPICRAALSIHSNDEWVINIETFQGVNHGNHAFLYPTTNQCLYDHFANGFSYW